MLLGHVDFAFEVYRSLVACNGEQELFFSGRVSIGLSLWMLGALVLIDSTQGVQAQTVANYHAAQKANLAMIPVLTKIDLPHADPEPCLNQIESALSKFFLFYLLALLLRIGCRAGPGKNPLDFRKSW